MLLYNKVISTKRKDGYKFFPLEGWYMYHPMVKIAIKFLNSKPKKC